MDVGAGLGNSQDGSGGGFECGYRYVVHVMASPFPLATTYNLLNRIDISGDTLMVDDLKAIPRTLQWTKYRFGFDSPRWHHASVTIPTTTNGRHGREARPRACQANMSGPDPTNSLRVSLPFSNCHIHRLRLLAVLTQRQ